MLNLTDEEITIIHKVLLDKVQSLAELLIAANEHEIGEISNEAFRLQEIAGKLIK
ncbi:hypothetical protein [Paenibacillus odorifer]|uniref:hypothetical protein n=1 Tax=Paenibacillus odorifer TaxID=189426 RepID=UPI0015C3C194|nr:hypothetical protein [Paenibacillus odorifer]